MRILTAVILILAIIWGGYWFVGAAAVERGANAWLARQAGGAVRVTHDDLSVGGFPNRFDVTVEAPRLDDPVSGIGWQAPRFQVYALSYRPNHLIAVWPERQEVHLPGGPVAVESPDLRASLVLTGGTALELDRLTLVGVDLVATGSAGWRLGLDRLRVAARRDEARAQTYDLAIEGEGFSPDADWHARHAPAGAPAAIERLRLATTLEFDAPLSRGTFEDAGAPRLRALAFTDIRFAWGDMLIWGDGALAIVERGVPEGLITLHTRNWRGLLDAAAGAGIVHPEIADTWARAFELLEEQSSSPDVLDLPLKFEAGRLRLGPLPLGRAPRLNAG